MSLPDPERDPQFYQGVALRRFTAGVIDTVVILVLMGGVLAFGLILGALTFGVALILAIGLFFVTGFLYRYLLITKRSATLGMIWTGIELRRRDGAPLDQATALTHTASYYITLMIPALLFGGWVLMGTIPHRRLMHDLLLGTTAINRPL
ncbi:MAG: RDD family protein [Pseudomonadota bacterium]